MRDFRVLNKSKYYSKAYEHAPRILEFYAHLYSDNKLRDLLRGRAPGIFIK